MVLGNHGDVLQAMETARPFLMEFDSFQMPEPMLEFIKFIFLKVKNGGKLKSEPSTKTKLDSEGYFLGSDMISDFLSHDGNEFKLSERTYREYLGQFSENETSGKYNYLTCKKHGAHNANQYKIINGPAMIYQEFELETLKREYEKKREDYDEQGVKIINLI